MDRNEHSKRPESEDAARRSKNRQAVWMYFIALLAAVLAVIILVFSPPAYSKPSRAAERPMENEILRIAQTAHGTTNPAQTGVRDVSLTELEEELASNRGPIIVEFYRTGYPDDPSIPDDCDNCANQLPVFEQAAQHYAGKVTFLRFNVDLHPQFMQLGLVVYPTHMFVMHTSTDLWTHSIRGYLSDADFQDAILQLYKIQP